jgi:hypothetical protein
MVMSIDRVTEWEEVKKHARVVARAWADPEFKERLLEDPRGVLIEQGFDVPAETDVSVVESSEGTLSSIGDVIYFSLPAKPAGGLGDEYLSGLRPQAGPQTSSPDSHGPQTSSPSSHGPQTSADCSGCFSGPSCGAAG